MLSDGAKLVLAAAKGDDAKVKRLLKAKADVNSSVVNNIGVVGTALQGDGRESDSGNEPCAG